MSERKFRKETIEWAESIGNKLGFSTDTVLGIYNEMFEKNPNFVKERVVSFLLLYSEGKDEV